MISCRSAALLTIAGMDSDHGQNLPPYAGGAQCAFTGANPGEDGSEWIERADRALYEVKETGRDGYGLAEDAAPGRESAPAHTR